MSDLLNSPLKDRTPASGNFSREKLDFSTDNHRPEILSSAFILRKGNQKVPIYERDH